MSSSTPLNRLAERLRQFRSTGQLRPSKNRGNLLRPSAVWTEAVSTAQLAVEPAWRVVRGQWLRFVWPILSIVSVLGWSILAGSILLWVVGQSFGWQEAKAAAIAAFVLFVIAVGLGSTCVFLASRSFPHHEAPAWAGALALASYYHLLTYLVRPHGPERNAASDDGAG